MGTSNQSNQFYLFDRNNTSNPRKVFLRTKHQFDLESGNDFHSSVGAHEKASRDLDHALRWALSSSHGHGTMEKEEPKEV